MPEGLDHYKVYRILDLGSLPVKRKVTLKDQFGSQEGVDIGKTVFFAVPVMKNHDDRISRINNEKGHLAIYQILPRTLHGKKHDTIDQFGKHSLTIGNSEMLAVPTVKLAWKALRL